MQEKRKVIPTTPLAKAIARAVQIVGSIIYILSVVVCCTSLAMCLVCFANQDLMGIVLYALVALISIHIIGQV